MRLSISNIFKNLHLLVLVLFIYGCDLEKESGFNRSMQNLTAHYNILFNANELLRQKQEKMALNYPDQYNDILSVYQDTAAKTATTDKDLDAVITKANNIISLKEQSHYVGEAYLLLGKANFLEANYYNAIEFFSYVIRSYPANKNLAQDARAWKGRAYMHINQLRMADTVLDTAINQIFLKQHNIADAYAGKLQYDIYTQNYADAENMAKMAIHYTHESLHRLRWTYILAQLQELNNKPAEAIVNYTHVENSNAPFEMAFNASLNRIRITDEKGNNKVSRIALLQKLLREDKNKEFTDQIYYQIGELYLAQNHIDLAVKNYTLSAHASTLNRNQKGMSYMRIAEIDFGKKADYAGAKKYYDSTLTYLSPNYPGYPAIRKKSDNLQLLTDRLQIISREDTLQMLSKLNEKDRLVKIDTIIKRDLAQKKAAALAAASNNNSQLPPQVSPVKSSDFYFYNDAAITQGANDFKRVWGNRALTDNWRRSVKASAEATSNAPAFSATVENVSTTSPGTGANMAPNKVDDTNNKARQAIIKSIPLTEAQIAQSNSKIFNAYMDIANFYRDILDDPKDAIAAYEILLARFPDKTNKPLVYYNLYRLYSNIDTAKSNRYKNLILKNYAETSYAKVIIDPDYNQKLNDRNSAFVAVYNKLFDILEHRRYTHAADTANLIIKEYPNSNYIAQVYYLRAIALGHSQTLDEFNPELKEIEEKFPDDRLITPLVKQHQAYIAANEAEIKQRKFVLVDNDPTQVPFMQQHDDYNIQPVIANTNKPVVKPAPIKPPVVKPAPTLSAQQGKQTLQTVDSKTTDNSLIPISQNLIKNFEAPGDSVTAVKKPEAPSIFSKRDSNEYYFVINVNTDAINLAPSRFGIGQYNRTHYQANSIKHLLKNVGINQLIYVGLFGNLADAKTYARGIAPLLPAIMKVTADKYNFFIITRQNLDKLTDLKTLESYFSFYQKNY